MENNQSSYGEQYKSEIAYFKTPKCVENLFILHQSYKLLMDLLEIFLEDYMHPTIEMNNNYWTLKAITFKEIKELNLDNEDGPIKINSFCKYSSDDFCVPFQNLFSVEEECRENSIEPNWNKIRPKMNVIFGRIDDLLQLVNVGDFFSESNEQNDLNNISSFLSKIKRRNIVNDLIVGPLVYTKNGLICYRQKTLKMRSQIKTLSVLFMNNHKDFIDYDKIKDEIIPAKKRPATSRATITKYVNELHILLRKHFKRDVIFNDEKEGYIFDIERFSEKMNRN
jgi:hypothetical protein